MFFSRRSFITIACVILSAVTSVAHAADALKPYILGSSSPGTIAAKLPEVKSELAAQGYEIAGEYSPYKGAHILAITSDRLKTAAANSDFGAYGAALRVSLTETEAGLQIAYSNPLYVAQVYRMKDDLAADAADLKKALGAQQAFGSKDGISASKLRKYHYMMMMPYFDDQVKLAAYPSQDEALAAVEANLTAAKGGSMKVYRVDVPGRKETLFGVAITKGDGADAMVMKVTDTAELKHTAHLPYELIVSDGTVYMLHGKFRIAQSFPDLTMGTFMKISGAPGDIEKQLKLVAGGK